MTELEKLGIPNSERIKCEVWRRSAAVANKFDLSAFTQQQKISVKSLKNFHFTSI